ncbi:beta-1,6-N-acetylglucosaminyltransferase [Sedimentitalea sp. HM32M-2]|uniref:DUF5927 domain-containing protein n=1 Tax=Sedimentitalea sp. HM32M-2 TaxID=3351566 RepID=UPI0036266FF9
MSLGVAMLVHRDLDRAAQIVRHWTGAGCPVVLHVDSQVPLAEYRAFQADLADDPLVRFCRRHRCEWGTWGIVAASQSASELLLDSFAQVHHVYLTSGACLPLRPVSELMDYLTAHPRTDFIESATTSDVPWTVGGLEQERFTLRFPFSWKKNRYLFDRYVALQRRLRLRRRIPEGLVPHMGSQWWCLTRQTLSAILQDPNRAAHDRYFRHVWIPDESYFQTLVRRYSTDIESRSLTLSKFDHQGKPHVFYDDHLHLLRGSGHFVARKIWPGADRLYKAFLSGKPVAPGQGSLNPGKIDRVFARAAERRLRGRSGLYMQSRLPRRSRNTRPTASPYSVFQGFVDLFSDFETWLERATGARVHGHLFAPDRVGFHGDRTLYKGGLSDSARKRDYAPEAFLCSLIWNTRGERQCFQFGPGDNQQITGMLVRDPNAHISVISGAWALPLFHSNRNFADLRKEAARLQKIENVYLQHLGSPATRAKVRIWNLADFVDAPMANLQAIIDEIADTRPNHLTEAPNMVDLAGFGKFLQNLKNQGMHPYLTGDFPVDPAALRAPKTPRKPYLVR